MGGIQSIFYGNSPSYTPYTPYTPAPSQSYPAPNISTPGGPAYAGPGGGIVPVTGGGGGSAVGSTTPRYAPAPDVVSKTAPVVPQTPIPDSTPIKQAPAALPAPLASPQEPVSQYNLTAAQGARLQEVVPGYSFEPDRMGFKSTEFRQTVFLPRSFDRGVLDYVVSGNKSGLPEGGQSTPQGIVVYTGYPQAGGREGGGTGRIDFSSPPKEAVVKFGELVVSQNSPASSVFTKSTATGIGQRVVNQQVYSTQISAMPSPEEARISAAPGNIPLNLFEEGRQVARENFYAVKNVFDVGVGKPKQFFKSVYAFTPVPLGGIEKREGGGFRIGLVTLPQLVLKTIDLGKGVNAALGGVGSKILESGGWNTLVPTVRNVSLQSQQIFEQTNPAVREQVKGGLVALPVAAAAFALGKATTEQNVLLGSQVALSVVGAGLEKVPSISAAAGKLSTGFEKLQVGYAEYAVPGLKTAVGVERPVFVLPKVFGFTGTQTGSTVLETGKSGYGQRVNLVFSSSGFSRVVADLSEGFRAYDLTNAVTPSFVEVFRKVGSEGGFARLTQSYLTSGSRVLASRIEAASGIASLKVAEGGGAAVPIQVPEYLLKSFGKVRGGIFESKFAGQLGYSPYSLELTPTRYGGSQFFREEFQPLKLHAALTESRIFSPEFFGNAKGAGGKLFKSSVQSTLRYARGARLGIAKPVLGLAPPALVEGRLIFTAKSFVPFSETALSTGEILRSAGRGLFTSEGKLTRTIDVIGIERSNLELGEAIGKNVSRFKTPVGKPLVSTSLSKFFVRFDKPLAQVDLLNVLKGKGYKPTLLARAGDLSDLAHAKYLDFVSGGLREGIGAQVEKSGGFTQQYLEQQGRARNALAIKLRTSQIPLGAVVKQLEKNIAEASKKNAGVTVEQKTFNEKFGAFGNKVKTFSGSDLAEFLRGRTAPRLAVAPKLEVKNVQGSAVGTKAGSSLAASLKSLQRGKGVLRLSEPTRTILSPKVTTIPRLTTTTRTNLVTKNTVEQLNRQVTRTAQELRLVLRQPQAEKTQLRERQGQIDKNALELKVQPYQFPSRAGSFVKATVKVKAKQYKPQFAKGKTGVKPVADYFSVFTSKLQTGRATPPAATAPNIAKFVKQVASGKQFFPTVQIQRRQAVYLPKTLKLKVGR